MNEGLRTHKSASVRLARCEALDESANARELVSLCSGNQGKGHARALMQEVCHEADLAGYVLIVRPGQYADGMTTRQLERWYERLGFVALPNEDGPVLMARCARRLKGYPHGYEGYEPTA